MVRHTCMLCNNMQHNLHCRLLGWLLLITHILSHKHLTAFVLYFSFFHNHLGLLDQRRQPQLYKHGINITCTSCCRRAVLKLLLYHVAGRLPYPMMFA
jgi:hypothetical protein